MDYKEMFLKELTKRIETTSNTTIKQELIKTKKVLEETSLYNAAIYDIMSLKPEDMTGSELYRIPDIHQAFIDMIKNPSLKSSNESFLSNDLVDVFKTYLPVELFLNDPDIIQFIKDMSYEQGKRFFNGASTNKLFQNKEIYDIVLSKAKKDERFYEIMDYCEHNILDGTCSKVAKHDKGGRKLINEEPAVQLTVISTLEEGSEMNFFVSKMNKYTPEVQKSIIANSALAEPLILEQAEYKSGESIIPKEHEADLVAKHLNFIKTIAFEKKLNFIYKMQDPEMQKYLMKTLKIVENLLSHANFEDFFQGIKDKKYLVECLCDLKFLKAMNSIAFRQLIPTLDLETQKNLYQNEVFQEFLKKHASSFDLIQIISCFDEQIIEEILPNLTEVDFSDYLTLYKNTNNFSYLQKAIDTVFSEEANKEENIEERDYCISKLLGYEYIAHLPEEDYKKILELATNKNLDMESALGEFDRISIPETPTEKQIEVAASFIEGTELSKEVLSARECIRRHEYFLKELEMAITEIAKSKDRVINIISYEIFNLITPEQRQIILERMTIEGVINHIAASKYVLDYCYDLYIKEPNLFENIKLSENRRVKHQGDQLSPESVQKLTKLFYEVPSCLQAELLNDALLSNAECLEYIINKIKENPNVYEGSKCRKLYKYLNPEELKNLLEGMTLTNLIGYYSCFMYKIAILATDNDKVEDEVLLSRMDEIIHEVNITKQTIFGSIASNQLLRNLYDVAKDKNEFLRKLNPSLLPKLYSTSATDQSTRIKNQYILDIISENSSSLIQQDVKDLKNILSSLPLEKIEKLITNYNTTDLVSLFAKSENKDIEQVLINKFKNNPYFINDTTLSLEEIFSRLDEENKTTIYETIDEQFNSLELPYNIKDKLKKSSYDEKIFLIYGVHQNIFNDEKYLFIVELLKRDPFALNSLNIKLLEDDVFAISKHIIPKIYRYENLTENYLRVLKNNNNRSRILLQCIKHLNNTITNEIVYIQILDTIINYLHIVADEKIDRYNINNASFEEVGELIEYILIDNTEHLIDTSLTHIYNSFSSRKTSIYDNFTTIEQHRKMELDLKMDEEQDLEKAKDIYCQKYFKITFEQSSGILQRYAHSLEEIKEYLPNKEVPVLLSDIKRIHGINSIEELKEMYYNGVQEYQISDYLHMYDELNKAYNLSIATDLKGYKNGNEKPLAVVVDEETVIVNAVELETNFDLFVHSTDAYGSMEMINDNYFDSWNYSEKTSNHGICASYISNSNLGTARVRGKGVMFGFVNLNENSISSLAPYDLVSRNDGIITTTRRPPMYTNTDSLADYTRHTHNEAVLERRNVSKDSNYPVIQPDCIIIFEEMTEENKSNAIRAQRDFAAQGIELPIVYINRHKVVELEARKVAEMIKIFQENPNLELLAEIINKYESNRCGLDFETDLNAEELFQKDVIYNLIVSTIRQVKETEDKDNAIKLINLIENENHKFKIIEETIGDRAHTFDLLDDDIKRELDILKRKYLQEEVSFDSNYTI